MTVCESPLSRLLSGVTGIWVCTLQMFASDSKATSHTRSLVGHVCVRSRVCIARQMRRADFYELAQFRIKPGLVDIRLQGGHGLKRGRAHLGDVNSLLHEDLAMAHVAPVSKIARKKCH